MIALCMINNSDIFDKFQNEWKMQAYHGTVFTFSLFSGLKHLNLMLVLNSHTDSFIVCPFSNIK